MTNLYPNYIYFVRAYATNSAGTSYGETITITALNVVSLPTVVTDAVTRPEHNSASVGGPVTADGDAPVKARGIYWGTAQNPPTANNNVPLGLGLGGFFFDLTGLVINTTYYFRAYATNSAETAYADQIPFTTGYKIGNVYQGGKIFYVDNTNYMD